LWKCLSCGGGELETAYHYHALTNLRALQITIAHARSSLVVAWQLLPTVGIILFLSSRPCCTAAGLQLPNLSGFHVISDQSKFNNNLSSCGIILL
jgi:hypothetical protein